MSLGPVNNNPTNTQVNRPVKAGDVQRTETTRQTETKEPTQPEAMRTPADASTVDATRQMNKGLEEQLQDQIGPQAGRVIKCGRGGRCMGDASRPIRGLGGGTSFA